MTGGLQGAGEEEDEPVITIQPDWEDSLFSGKKEVWISCKLRGRDGTHSKLRFNGGASFTSDDFTVTEFKRNQLTLRHSTTGYTCTFYPPVQTYTSIHNKKIVSLDVAETGDLAVSVCTDNNLIVWNTRTGAAQTTLTGHIVNVYKCKFFPSGVVVLTGGSDMQMKIWCAKTGICPVTLIGHRGPVHDFCIVDRGRNIISVSKDGTARLWDCGQAECLDIIFNSENVLNCCTIGEITNSTDERLEREVSSREIGTKGKLLLIGSEEGFIYGLDVYRRRVMFSISVGSAVNTIIVKENRFAIGCQNGKIEVFEMTGNEVKKLKLYFMSNSPVLCGHSYKDGFFVIGRNDGTVNCFPFNSNSPSSHGITLTGPDFDPIYSIATRKDEIFTACRDSKIRRYVVGNT